MFSKDKTENNYDLILEKLTYGGAIGRLKDGVPAFVPFGLPSERVRIELMEEKSGFESISLFVQ